MGKVKVLGVLFGVFLFILIAAGQTTTAANIVTTIGGGIVSFCMNFGSFVGKVVS